MRRLGLLLAGAVLPCALFVAQPALGQLAGGLGGESGTLSSGGTVHGIVKHRDFSRGILEIASGSRSIAIHATPDQLTDYRVGDDVDVDYDDYAGVRWLSGGGGAVGEGIGGSLGGNGSYGEEGSTSGTVASVDTARGIVRIQEVHGVKSFHAHPETLQDVIPGQFVTLSYDRIGRTAWVEDIEQGGTGGTGFRGGGLP